MIEWLTDTLVATGALMALVLAARRPVARWFGPGAAYALWLLPMIRLILPPLALPRGLLPKIELTIEPLTAAALRALPAGLLLLAVRRRLPRGAWWWRSLVLSVLNCGAFFVLVYLAAKLLPTSLAAMLMSLSPIAMMLIAWGVVAERPTLRRPTRRCCSPHSSPRQTASSACS